MKDYLIKNAKVIVLVIVELIIGILLIINPTAFSNLVIRTVGIVFIALGIFKGITYFKTEALLAEAKNDLFIALVLLSAGIFAVADTAWFSTTFPMFTVIYGIFLFVVGLFKVQMTSDQIRQRKPNPIVKGVTAILTLALSIVIILNPFTYLETTWTACAAIFIILGACDIVGLFLEQKDLTIKVPKKEEPIPAKIETERVIEAQPVEGPVDVDEVEEIEEITEIPASEPAPWVDAGQTIETDDDKIV